MFDQPFITEEHRMAADLYRKFVNKEIMPVRHLIKAAAITIVNYEQIK